MTKKKSKTEEISLEESIPKEDYDLYRYFTKEELEETAKELVYMEKHPKEYKSYNNWDELESDLLSDD